MSKPSHRKSQSTSALAFLASQPSEASSSSSSSFVPSLTRRDAGSERKGSQHAKYRHRSTMLPSVKESSSSASLSVLPGLSGPSTRRDSSVFTTEITEEDIESWLSDIRSLRSSDRRRLAALRNLEKALVTACARDQDSRDGYRALERLTSQAVQQALISLLTRHTQTLAHRAASKSIPLGDEVTAILVPELDRIMSMLQGICLLSKGCKASVGEGWVLEIFIDLLLLLRAQPAMGEGAKPIAYNLIELLFCVLVDSPKTARTFEKLSGLEAVTRVLKGTGVSKDVRMKCIEFLYFYLLPEQNETPRAVSSSSTSSSSSADSHLYPPSPLSTSHSSNDSITIAKVTSHRSPSPDMTRQKLADVDLPFVPMTPRKPPQPALGYLTPSTRRVSVCGSASSTPSLATVPASPRVEHSASSRGLAAMLDEMEEPAPVGATPRSSRMGRTQSDDSERSTGGVGVGLGLGLPKSSSGMVRSSTVQRDTLSGSGSASSPSPSPFIDPFNLTANSERSHSGSSGSSTVAPSPRTMSRSSTQPTLAVPPGNPRLPSTVRRTSVRRVSKSPLVQSTVPEQGETPERPKSSVGPASTSESMQAPSTRTPKMRHSRTQSHLSALSMPPPVPPIPSHMTPTTDHRAPGAPVALGRSPSTRMHRAFPAELTRGLPSSASSPVLAQMASSPGPTPLGATKRVPSDRRPSVPSVSSGGRKDEMPDPARMGVGAGHKAVPRVSRGPKDVRSVEEKKEMLGMWLGNVEQLVQGVEKVSIWGSVGAGAAGGGRGKR